MDMYQANNLRGLREAKMMVEDVERYIYDTYGWPEFFRGLKDDHILSGFIQTIKYVRETAKKVYDEELQKQRDAVMQEIDDARAAYYSVLFRASEATAKARELGLEGFEPIVPETPALTVEEQARKDPDVVYEFARVMLDRHGHWASSRILDDVANRNPAPVESFIIAEMRDFSENFDTESNRWRSKESDMDEVPF